jgi:hypothetical protein
MKKIILLALLVAAGTGAKLSAQIDANGPKMTFVGETSYDFGKITQGDIVKKDFTVKNTGKQPLIINNITTPCGCTTPEWPKAPIAPGKTGVIHVEFNSANKMGQQEKELHIQSNSIDGEELISLKGEVLAAKPASK